MKKFSKILETKEDRHYKVEAKVDLIIPSENQGEAGYLADSILAGNRYSSDYIILNIEETQERISESKSEIKRELKGNRYEMVSGIIDILKKVKDEKNRMEIANDMIKQFKSEDINFDYNKFLDSIK